MVQRDESVAHGSIAHGSIAHGSVAHPENMPSMKARKEDSAAIAKVFRLYEEKPPRKAKESNRTRYLTNRYSPYFKSVDSYEKLPSEVEDVIHGVAFLDHYNKGMKQEKSLSKVVLSHLMSYDTLSSPLISEVLGVGERQAQRYMKAVSLIISHLDEHQETLQKHFTPLIKKWCDSILEELEEMMDDIEEWEEETGEVFSLQEHIDDTINSMLIMYTQGWDGKGAMELVNGLVLPLPEIEEDWETEF